MKIFSPFNLIILASALLGGVSCAQQTPATPNAARAIGQWDGVTASLPLAGPYESNIHRPTPFGALSYYNHPWRAYMDTQPASHFVGAFGTQANGLDLKDAPALFQLMSESGISNFRIEISWGNFGWNDKLVAGRQTYLGELLRLCKSNNIRPLILLNANHGIPGPVRAVKTTLSAAAKKGDRTIRLAPDAKIRVGYTGLDRAKGGAPIAFPLITAFAADGTATLSAPLPADLPAGDITLQELKYQPFQDGVTLVDGTALPAARETYQGWLRYARATGEFARAIMGTPDDAGFDIEVWNEQSFGSNFLDINRYYEPKREYGEKWTYQTTRARTPQMAPDARLKFEQPGLMPGKLGAHTILPMTVDLFADPQNGFGGVNVISGFSNQWPWDTGVLMWANQAGFSRHYYTGEQGDVSPAKPLSKGTVINATGQADKTAWTPTLSLAFPEFWFTGFKVESAARDTFPDSRFARGWPVIRTGVSPTTAIFKTPLLMQTETEWNRAALIKEATQAAGVAATDPRVQEFARHVASKMMLRQYLFMVHKGFDRIYLYSADGKTLNFGLLTPDFYEVLEQERAPAHARRARQSSGGLERIEMVHRTDELRPENRNRSATATAPEPTHRRKTASADGRRRHVARTPM